MQLPKKEIVIPAGGAKPLAPYSPGIRLGNLVFTSGQVGLHPDTQKIVAGGVQAEARQALENVSKVLEAAGTSLDNAVKVTVFMVDMNDYARINEVYGEFFKEDPPARSAVQVGALPAGAMVEIEAIAVVG